MTFAVYSFLIAQKQILFFILTVILALRCGTALIAEGVIFMPCSSDEAAFLREKAEIRSKRSVPTHNSGLIFQRTNICICPQKKWFRWSCENKYHVCPKKCSFSVCGQMRSYPCATRYRSFVCVRRKIQLSTGHIRRGMLCLSAMFMV